MTYAEVKAIASGNPLVIEKAAVDAEVTRLTRLKKQHVENQYQLRYRIRALGETAEICDRHIANLREDLAVRFPTKADSFTMKIRGETFTDRTKAGRQLIFIAAALKPLQATKPIGEIGGFPISIQKLDESANVLIHGKNTYQASINDTPLGTISSLEHALNSLDIRHKDRETELDDHLAKRETLSKHLGEPFEYEDQLEAATVRQQEILSALDLTKNQAAVIADGSNEETAEVIEEKPETNRRTIATAHRVSHGNP